MIDSTRIRVLMEEAGLDAVVAASPENVLYMSGVNILTQRLIPDRLALCLWSREGDPAMLVCIHEEPQARRDSHIQHIHTYFEFKESPIEAAARVLRSMGLSTGRIGLEKRFVTAHYYEEWLAHLPRVTTAAADGLFDALRAIKSQQEVALLETVALITDRAVRSAFEMARPGDSERDVAAAIRQRLFEYGADELRPLMLGAGRNSPFIHQLPTSYRLGAGDLCRVDLGAIKQGYQSDIARTAVGGLATERQRDAYRRLWGVHEEVIASIHPGITGADVYATYSRVSQVRGVFRRRPHIGHGLGLGMHEAPFLTPGSTQRLEVGMVMCVEYTHACEDELYHIEDTVEVTPEGCRVLSRAADWSELFVMG